MSNRISSVDTNENFVVDCLLFWRNTVSLVNINSFAWIVLLESSFLYRSVGVWKFLNRLLTPVCHPHHLVSACDMWPTHVLEHFSHVMKLGVTFTHPTSYCFCPKEIIALFTSVILEHYFSFNVAEALTTSLYAPTKPPSDPNMGSLRGMTSLLMFIHSYQLNNMSDLPNKV